ncbi:MAG TPA: TonB family protein [Steroidobacteraceae bacterium]|nr:TonB family protein [Steroidobacteraceae bacterium]
MASSAANASQGPETGTTSQTSGTSPASKPTVDLIALTTRDDFLLELGESLGGQASVRPVDSIAAAIEHLTGTKRAQLLVVDTRDIADVRGDVEQALAQAPHTVALLFANSDAEKQLGTTVKGSNVFAVLPIPIDKRKTSAVLEGAITEAVAKKSAARMAPTPSPGITVEPFQLPKRAAGATEPPEREKSKAPLWAALGIVTVALAGGGYWFVNQDKNGAAPAVKAPKATATAAAGTKGDNTTTETLEPQPVVDTSIVNGKVDDLLEKARLAMRERRYLDPTGDNALLYYRSAAAADPNNGEALDGLQRVAGVAANRFEESLNAAKYEEASLALANLKLASPTDSRVGPFELKLATAQISKALADGNLDRAAALVRQAQQSPNIPADQLARWRTDIARRQEDVKVQRLSNLVADRIREGRLTEPADDDAKAYAQQLHDLAPANPTTQRALRDLGAAYLRRARDAALAKNNVDEDHWMAEARGVGVTPAEIAGFQRDLASARLRAAQAEADRLVQAARDRMRDGKLTDPAQDSAVYYLTQLQTSDPSNPALLPASHDLAQRLLDRAKTAALAGKATLVEPDLTQAKRWGADAKDILAIQQLQAAKPAATPAAGSARSATAGLTAQQLASRLKRTKYVAPEFPSKALAQHVGGLVTVEYTVGTNGETHDVRVIEANPPGMFDHSAVSAVKRWRYDPVVVNGSPVEVPVRTAIRFELPPP